MGNTKFQTITVRKVPVSLWRQAKARAAEEGIPMAELLSKALGTYLRKERR